MKKNFNHIYLTRQYKSKKYADFFKIEAKPCDKGHVATICFNHCKQTKTHLSLKSTFRESMRRLHVPECTCACLSETWKWCCSGRHLNHRAQREAKGSKCKRQNGERFVLLWMQHSVEPTLPGQELVSMGMSDKAEESQRHRVFQQSIKLLEWEVIKLAWGS